VWQRDLPKGLVFLAISGNIADESDLACMTTGDDQFTLVPRTAQDILDSYARGERNFRRVDVAERSSFRGANLSGADFTESFVSDLDFRDADLRDTRFDKANVKLSDFRGANLSGASFRDSLLCGARFRTAKLNNVVVQNAGWYGFSLNSVQEIVEACGTD
jgi:uncharacterized protein YjbI with pentapeptide repeats